MGYMPGLLNPLISLSYVDYSLNERGVGQGQKLTANGGVKVIWYKDELVSVRRLNYSELGIDMNVGLMLG